MTDLDYFNTPISVTDASSMLRAQIGKNELPYTAKIMKLNNRLVDEWEKKVLRKMSNKRGNVPSGKVWPSWQLFKEGRELHQYSTIRHLIPRPSKDQLDFWINLFEESTIEDLHEMGVGMLDMGWKLIDQEIKLWSVDKKWEVLFSKSDDPLKWESMAPSHQNLLRGELFPFWNREKLTEIGEKIGTIFALQIEPNAFRRKITYNMRPLTKIVAKLNNNLVSEWEKQVLGTVTTRDKVSIEEYKKWSLWYEEKGLQTYKKVKDKFPNLTQEQFTFWKELLERSSLEELHAKGVGVVSFAHRLIETYIRKYVADQKLEKVYKEGSSPEDWVELSVPCPFWDDDTLKKVSMKVGTILTVQVTPEN